MGLIKEFREFLAEYKVIGLAVAFVIGAAVTTLVKSLVGNIIMPLINPLLPSGGWATATLALGPFIFGWGAFLSELINFLIIAFVIFMIVKMVLREGKPAKK